VLTRAFGVQTEVLRDVSGITAAYLYGSWAARHADLRPVGDIDVLVLGDPDRDQLYAAVGTTEPGRCRPQSATTWLESGSGAFHDTIACRTLLRLSLLDDWPNRSGVMLRRPGCCAGITAT
jgi:hypothetical protein